MGKFSSKKVYLIAVFLAFAAAATSPLWGLDWEAPMLPFWSAFVFALLIAGLWMQLRPVHSYPATDIGFVVSVVLAVNLLSTLLGPGRHWLQPMNFLVVALCALYYPIRFNLAAAGAIFLLEGLNLASMRALGSVEQLVNLAVFGAYLMGIALVMGRLFQSEHRKKERAIQAVKRLQEGANSLGIDNEDAPIGSISPESRMSSAAASAEELDVALHDLLATARTAIPSERALLFMTASAGDSVYLRIYSGGEGVKDDVSLPFGQGMVGWVAKEKRPLLVADEAHGLGYLKDESEVRSFLAAPIMNGGTLEGVVALDSKAAGVYSEQDRDTLCRFAQVFVYLLQGAREYQQADRSAKKFAALHRISADVSSSLDLETILEKLARLSSDILPYDYLTISFLEGKDQVSFKLLKGYDGLRLPPGPVPHAGSLIGWIVENGQHLCFTDLDQRVQKLPIFPLPELKTDCRSFLGMPFISQDQVLGVFTLALRQSGGISAFQHDMLSITANLVAASIANARLHQMMRQMATTDGLTGLINHRHFQEKADAEFQRAARFPQPVSVLIFDIDHFKNVNDTYGHPVGDAVLKRVAKILRETVRTVDVAARYGGEEFVTLLANTDRKGVMQMAERIRTTIEKNRFALEGRRIPISVSVGAATYPDDAIDKKDLIDKADQALYWAKSHGRNRCCHFSQISGVRNEA